jgi:PHD/YefM family antitoxin component YafN of YafNO toxin-antitoxin module
LLPVQGYRLSDRGSAVKPQPQYVVDDEGKRRAVLLSMEEYQRLLDALEDQLDAKDLDEAIAEGGDFVPYDQVQEGLLREGKL